MREPTPIASQVEVLDALESSDFNLKLAGEKLGKSASLLLAELTPDAQSSLISKMRLRAALELYKTWQDTQLVFIAALGEAEPEDVIKAFGALTKSVSEMFAAQPQHTTNNLNVGLGLLNQLPPSVRDAVLKELESYDAQEDPETSLESQAPISPKDEKIRYLPRHEKPDDDQAIIDGK